MKSDRLLSLLLLLQTHQRLAAPELARRLEVSVRTIYRDAEALSTAGIPVYAERGRYGGVALLPGFRTDVSGLTPLEAQALFVFTGRGDPGDLRRGAADDLGRGEALRQAVRKLLSAVPATHSPEAARLAERIVIDPVSWHRSRQDIPHLGVLQDAVLTDRRLQLRYPSRSRRTEHVYPVDAYGLVAKAGVWYLLGGTPDGIRTFRVSRIIAVTGDDATFQRPTGLDLDELWQQTRRRVQPDTSGYPVRVRVHHPDTVAMLERTCADQLLEPIRAEPGASADPSSRTGTGSSVLRLVFRGVEHAVPVLLSYGGQVEVLAPDELRSRVAGQARAAAALYDGPACCGR